MVPIKDREATLPPIQTHQQVNIEAVPILTLKSRKLALEFRLHLAPLFTWMQTIIRHLTTPKNKSNMIYLRPCNMKTTIVNMFRVIRTTCKTVNQ